MKLKMELKNLKKEIGFNQKLYLDGIRQLKLVGIMGLVVCCAAAMLTAMGYHINTSVYVMDEFGNMIRRVPKGLNLFQAHWSLFITFPVLVPVMTMMLFNFLNHRNASDFYHAIPDTRGSLYISYSASILTWIGAIIGISTLFSVISVSLLPTYYIIWSGVPKVLFLIISACVLVMGGVLIALGLTGTRMSNLMVTLIILFLPRVFVTVIMYILEEMMPFVAWEYSTSLFNPRYDLIAGLPIALFSGINPFQYGGSGVYSLILGLVYLMAGYVIFIRRKSESAGHAAISPKLQGVFRLAVSLMICLLPMYYISNCWVDLDYLDGETLFIILVFYVIAVLVYFIYELMTTGKLRAFKKLCRGIGVLAGLNVLLFLVIIGIYGTTIKNTPDADRIDYIMLRGEERDYFKAQLQQIRIRDEEVAQVTSNALKRAIERSRSNYYGKYKDQYGNIVETVSQTVAINVGMKTIYRDVLYTVTEWNVVSEYLSQRPEYYQVYSDLPAYDDKEMSIYCESGNMSASQVAKIYEVMREEVKTIDFEEWYTAIENYYYGNDKYVDYIRLSLSVGTTGYRDTIRLPILYSMTETLTCYFAELQSASADKQMLKDWNMIREMADGTYKEEYKTSDLYIFLNARIVGKKTMLDGIDGSLEGSNIENSWRTKASGIANEKNKESFLTMIDRLFAGEYEIDTQADAFLIVEIDANGNAYHDGDKAWASSRAYGKFVIPISDQVPEEIEELMGEVLDKYEQLNK
jgi:ABC-2 type transport system permease protein